jgi:hypothetical protein
MKQASSLYLFILLILPTATASGTGIYTWVDDAGITHFSESPPSSTTTQRIDILPTPAPSSEYSVDADYYSVINQAQRMETRRLENEKLIAEKQQADAEAIRARAQAAAIQQGAYKSSASDNDGYYPLYLYRPRHGRHPWKPGHGHWPGPAHPVPPVQIRPRNPRTSLGKTPGMPGQTGSWR